MCDYVGGGNVVLVVVINRDGNVERLPNFFYVALMILPLCIIIILKKDGYAYSSSRVMWCVTDAIILHLPYLTWTLHSFRGNVLASTNIHGSALMRHQSN